MEKIGRYQVLGEIGRGAMGVVYRAQDPAIGRVIAIKTIRLSDLSDEGERERLRDRLFREAQSAGILSHPNIVTIYDIAEEKGLAFIFMELVNGPSLEKILADGAPENQDFLNILKQTASALDYAHKKGIVHRDIKPANIMIHEDGQAKITDFGVAKIISQQMTQAGAMMGTPNYMSPEQVQGHPVDGRADQFSLAVIAYEVLTGEKPFAGDYLPTLLYKIVREEPIAPQRMNPTLTVQVDMVLRRALAKTPEERYATCTEFINALSFALGNSAGWRPMSRGASQSLPTVTDVKAAREEEAGEPAAAGAMAGGFGAGATTRVREENERNPLVRSLVWVLVGIGIVGLALLGAQKFLFDNGGDRTPPVAETKNPEAPAQPQTNQSPGPVAGKPSPITPAEPSAPPRPTAPPASQEEQPQQTPAEMPRRTHATAPDVAPPSGPATTVQFITEPAGATITVDSNQALSCKTPCMLQVPPGRHVLNAQLDGYRGYPSIFNEPGQSDMYMRLNKLMGSLSITSTPPGASIMLNGQEQSQKTPALLHMPPGKYHVRVSRNGVPLDFDVEIVDGGLISKNVDFR
jgi:serine/threonine-protein kinase